MRAFLAVIRGEPKNGGEAHSSQLLRRLCTDCTAVWNDQLPSNDVHGLHARRSDVSVASACEIAVFDVVDQNWEPPAATCFLLAAACLNTPLDQQTFYST